MDLVKKIWKYIRNNLDILLVFCGLICIEMLMRKMVGIKVLTARPIIFSIFFSGFFASLMFMMGKKTRLVYSIIILLFWGLVGGGQVLHYAFFGTFFSASKISIISEAFQVRGEAAAKFDYKLLVFLLPVIGAIIVFFLRGKKIEYPKLIRYGLTGIVSIFCVVCMFITVITYPVNETDMESDAYLYSTLYNKVKAVDKLGFYSFEIKDVQQTMSGNASNEDTEIDKVNKYLESNGYTHEDNKYTGLFEGKNLILVLCESLAPVAIQEELTPTLYMMQNEGFNFSNNYSPIYQSATADSEFISLTSLVPSVNYGPTAYIFYQNTYSKSLANMLNEKGYDSNSFHSFHSDFYNRNIFHPNLGFSKFYADQDLYFEKLDGWQEAYNWPLDKYLFQQTMEKTDEVAEEPFFDFVISVSGHIPYNPYRYEMEGDLWGTKQILGEENDPYSIETLCYFAGQKALDEGLKQLITELELRGELDDTVIAIYGDHYPYGMTASAQKEIFSFDEAYKINHTPFIIWTPNMEHVEVDKVTSTFDIYPTLANLFNIDLNGDFIAGTDALSDEKGIVFWEDYSWLTDDAYYNSTTQKLSNYNNISQSEVDLINQKVMDKINVGQSILVSDYFRIEDN